MKILLIEDDKALCETVRTLLTQKGFDVDCALDGADGLSLAERGIYDLLILDVMLPKMDGYEVATRLRSNQNHTPILMLTARSELEDRIRGLDSGADYYLTKPFEIRELMACINALMRRQGSQLEVLQFGNTTLDLESNILKTPDQEVQLSAKEFHLMELLMQNPHRNTSKDTILNKVWGYDSTAVENHVEVYIGFLRKKLASIQSNVSIVTVRKLGYHLEVDFR